MVESNSSDGSREIVRSFDGVPGVQVVLEDQPCGKGHAVRAGLAASSGTIVLIQDADFEYDLDDYEALLEPILQHHTSFVLGSRSLGLDDWKVRRYASSKVKGFLMNAAQVAFAKTFNLLYQQKVKDINTMFKVFRRECIDGCHFDGDGFNFDIELVCKIVRNGFSPLEVPVNYVARGASTRERRSASSSMPTRRTTSSSGVGLERSDLYAADHRWGAAPIDVSARDLPALKARYLLSALPARGRVLEIGCGGGRLLNTIALHRPDLDLEGCDIRPLDHAPKTFEFTLVEPARPDLPYDADTFDVVLLFDVLEHVLDPPTMLKATRSVMRGGGAVISFTPLEGQAFSFYRFYRRLLGDDLYVETKEHLHAFSDASLRALLEVDFVLNDVQYAYHFFGHLMDATLFALTKFPPIRRRFWESNPYYRDADSVDAGKSGRPLHP